MNIKPTILGLLLCLSIFAFISPAGIAQVSEKEKAQKDLERKQQLEHKTYVLVDEIASGALSLKLPENRSFVLSVAADLMWENDQKRARSLFWDALNTLSLMMNPVSADRSAKPSVKERAQSQSSYFAVFSIRQQLLRKVAKRDPQFALDLLRATRQPPPEPVNAGFRLPDERDLEQEIAAEAVGRDPRRALQLARESLAKGLTFQLLKLLYRLNDKDTELGTRFAGEILEKLQTHDISTDLHGWQIAIDLVISSRDRKEESEPRVPAPKIFRRIQLDKDQRRTLVELIANAALGTSVNKNLLWVVPEVMPEFEEFVPERVALLQKKFASFSELLNKEQKVSLEYQALLRKGTPEEMLAFALKSGEEGEWIQREAILGAVMYRRADSMREFINSKVENEVRRRDLLDALNTEQIGEAAYRSDLEELRKVLPLVRLKEERARAMACIARLLEKKGDHDEAVKLLDEARTLIKADLNSETQTNALLELVLAYALVEPAKAFAILERTVDRANRELAKAILLDKIVRSGAIKKGEIRLQQAGMIPIDFAMMKYGEGVAALGNADFDRLKAVADRFERNELRLMARLLLAQALLKTTIKP